MYSVSGLATVVVMVATVTVPLLIKLLLVTPCRPGGDEGWPVSRRGARVGWRRGSGANFRVAGRSEGPWLPTPP